MLAPWSLVRPNYWHTISAMEQSMMDFERLMDDMMTPSLHYSLTVPHEEEDDKFFEDLPVEAEKLSQKRLKNKQNKTKENTFSSYSYSSSSVLDDKGKKIETIRRRYEDSKGRLKAEHKRKIGDKVITATWNRMHKDQEGEHKTIVSGDCQDKDEFEKLWNETPFAKAAKEKEIEPDKSQKQEVATSETKKITP